MAWAKVDDGWWSHPKVLDLSLEARGLWISALSWSCAQRRDVVPLRFVTMLDEAGEAIADELVNAGLWVPVDGGWRIHDWPEYQELSLSEKRADAGRKGGLASGKTRATGKQPGSKPKQKVEANAEAGTQPGPTPPDQTHPEVVEIANARQTTRVSSSLPAVPAESNGRNPFYDACMDAFDMPQSGSHEGMFGAIAAKAQTGGHEPDEIRRRVALHLAVFNFPATPGSVNKRWDELGSRVVTATESQRKEMARQMERMQRRDRIYQGGTP